MTTTPPAAPDPGPGPSPEQDHVRDEGPRVTAEELRDVRRLRRPRERTVAGVAAGLARHLDVDPLLLRVAFVLLVFLGGSGVVLYGGLWLLMPEDDAEDAVLPLDERNRGLAVLGVGALATVLLLGDTWGAYRFPWPLAVAALVVWFLFFRDRPTSTATGSAPGYQGATYQGATYQGAPAPATTAPAPTAPAPTAPASPDGAHTAEGTTADAYTAEGITAQTPAWAPPPPVRRPRDPRRRGPILFWATLALVALAEGVLGLLDVAGTPVLPSAYPALALGVVGAMLVLGSLWGRAGGLILLGVVAAAATAGTVAVEQLDRESRVVTPDSAADVDGLYEMRSGELTLDLTQVADPEELDGRAIRIEGGVGRLNVLVPDDVEVDVYADVGVGSIRLFDRESGGLGVSLDDQRGERDLAERPDGRDLPVVMVEAELGVGEISVSRQQ